MYGCITYKHIGRRRVAGVRIVRYIGCNGRIGRNCFWQVKRASETHPVNESSVTDGQFARLVLAPWSSQPSDASGISPLVIACNSTSRRRRGVDRGLS